MGHTGIKLDGRVCKCVVCAASRNRERHRQAEADARTEQQRQALDAARARPYPHVEYALGCRMHQVPVRVWRRDAANNIRRAQFTTGPYDIIECPMFLNPGEAATFINAYVAEYEPNSMVRYVILDATIPVA